MGRFLALAVIATALMGCDVVTSKYGSIAEARADQLFDRGWLPEILPPSATDIRVSNNLDLNISEGEFRFPPNEAANFKQAMKPGAPESAPFEKWERERAHRRRDGFSEVTYQRDRHTWVFFCKFEAGRCEYVMWGSRG
jgi:hypothetical protein